MVIWPRREAIVNPSPAKSTSAIDCAALPISTDEVASPIGIHCESSLALSGSPPTYPDGRSELNVSPERRMRASLKMEISEYCLWRAIFHPAVLSINQLTG